CADFEFLVWLADTPPAHQLQTAQLVAFRLHVTLQPGQNSVRVGAAYARVSLEVLGQLFDEFDLVLFPLRAGNEINHPESSSEINESVGNGGRRAMHSSLILKAGVRVSLPERRSQVCFRLGLLREGNGSLRRNRKRESEDKTEN